MRHHTPLVLLLAVFLPATTLLAAPPAHDQLFKDLLSAAATIKDPDDQAEALSHIVMAQARLDDFAAARLTADKIPPSDSKNIATYAIAEELALTGDFTPANALLDKLEGDPKANIYRILARGMARKGDLPAAQTAAAKITYSYYATQAARYIALAQASLGNHDAARTTLSTIPINGDAVEAYVELAAFQVHAQKLPEARKTMDLARTAAKETSAYPQSHLAAGEIFVGNTPAAAAIVAQFPSPNDQSMILTHIANAQVDIGDLQGAQATIAKLADPVDKIRAYKQFLPALAVGNKAQAQSILKEALELLSKIQDSFPRSQAANALATAMAAIDSPEAATTWANSQSDPQVRVAALLGVLEFVPLAK